jgi:hypothetical protein
MLRCNKFCAVQLCEPARLLPAILEVAILETGCHRNVIPLK